MKKAIIGIIAIIIIILLIEYMYPSIIPIALW